MFDAFSDAHLIEQVRLVVDTALITALAIALVVAGYAFYLRYRTATPDEIAALTRRLVAAAEQQWQQPKAGQTKYGWVMGRLQRRFPDVEWEALAEYVEEAVHSLNTARAAYIYRNGTAPRDGE